MANKNWGVCKFIFTLNLKNWKGQKLRRNIKIYRELVIFNFHFPKYRNVFIFRILGLMGFPGIPKSSLIEKSEESLVGAQNSKVGWWCGGHQLWLYGYVALWLWLCSFVAIWLCGYSELCAHPPAGGRLLMPRSHMAWTCQTQTQRHFHRSQHTLASGWRRRHQDMAKSGMA